MLRRLTCQVRKAAKPLDMAGRAQVMIRENCVPAESSTTAGCLLWQYMQWQFGLPTVGCRGLFCATPILRAAPSIPQELDDGRRRLVEMETDMTGMKAKLSVMETKLSAMEAELTVMKTAISSGDQQKRIDAQQERIDAQRNDIRALQNDIRAQQKRIDAQRNDIRALQNDIRAQQKRIDKQQKRIDDGTAEAKKNRSLKDLTSELIREEWLARNKGSTAADYEKLPPDARLPEYPRVSVMKLKASNRTLAERAFYHHLLASSTTTHTVYGASVSGMINGVPYTHQPEAEEIFSKQLELTKGGPRWPLLCTAAARGFGKTVMQGVNLRRFLSSTNASPAEMESVMSETVGMG